MLFQIIPLITAFSSLRLKYICPDDGCCNPEISPLTLTKPKTGGNRQFIPSQTFAAVSSGVDGVFMEVHDDVDNALSDASTQWPIDKLEDILKSIISFIFHHISRNIC